jgi:O-methyltransferase domain/Dimerisation domain
MATSDPYSDIMRLLTGYRISQAIHVAATLGVADLLKDGPRATDALAAATNTDPRTLYRLLRALAAAGIFCEETDRQFSLAPMGEYLRTDAPRPVGPFAAFIARPYVWQAWGQLLHCVRTGENAFHHVHGASQWDYQSRHPEEGAIFARAMTGYSIGIVEAVLRAYDFSSFACVVDVGGGEGTQLAAILARHPAMRGILLDQPEIVTQAQPVLAAAGVDGRCDAVGGTFFEAVPGGGDAYLLKFILHDWDDAASVTILKNCRKACGPKAKLLVVEQLLASPNEGLATKLADLQMLVGPGGEERTEGEFASLFTAAGFRLEKIIVATTGVYILECQPA